MAKQRVDEGTAAQSFVRSVLRMRVAAWEQLATDLKAAGFESSAYGVNSQKAAIHLALATMSWELRALPNLFPASQAASLRQLCIAVLSDEDVDLDGWALLLEEYARTHDGLSQAHSPTDVFQPCVERLFEKIVPQERKDALYPNLSKHVGKPAPIFNPLIVIATMQYVVGRARWKTALEKYDITEFCGQHREMSDESWVTEAEEPTAQGYQILKAKVERYWRSQKPDEVKALEQSGEFKKLVEKKALSLWRQTKDLVDRGADQMQILEAIEPQISPAYSQQEMDEEFS